jgi:hypothetical protein
MALRQRFHERQPALRSGGAMQKKQGLTLTPTHESNAASGDCLKCLPVRHVGLGLLVNAALLPMGEFGHLQKSVHLCDGSSIQKEPHENPDIFLLS